MKTLNWNHADWIARNFIFSIGKEIVGQLAFNNHWTFNAVYTDQETHLKFTQKSLLDRDAIITKDEEKIGEIKFGLFGTQTLKLVTGERFFLSTSLWEQEAYWKNEKGDTIIKYQQATMSSMGKGQISLTHSLTNSMEKVLVSSGLFARQAKHKRSVLLLAIMIPMIAATSRL